MPPAVKSHKLYINAYEENGELYFRDMDEDKADELKLNPDKITRTPRDQNELAAGASYGESTSYITLGLLVAYNYL